MSCRKVCVAVAATMLAVLPGVALAQFPPAPVQDRWPDPPKPGQAERVPPAQPAPKRAPAPAPKAEDPAPAPPKRHAAAPAHAVVCGGLFAKDSTHLKLAIKYDSRNITHGQVDGPDGTKIPGSILFPNDPRRRLEVLWINDAGRSGVSVIAINGKSQWTAPKGMKLGLPIAALEKANGKPFKISGFGADGIAGVAGWEDGALSKLPGGCKMGMRLHADPKAPDEARKAVPGDKEFLSSDANVRALKPTVMEILIGY